MALAIIEIEDDAAGGYSVRFKTDRTTNMTTLPQLEYTQAQELAHNIMAVIEASHLRARGKNAEG